MYSHYVITFENLRRPAFAVGVQQEEEDNIACTHDHLL
jgi:hypothetical protein